jgi:aryl-alcohol dehydrogenase-like predicted oxidoreductase
MARVQQAQAVAARLGVDTNQLALAWVLTRGANICVIPGTTKLANLESNMKAAEVADRLTKEDLELLEKLETFDGDRYTLKFTYKDVEAKL